QAVINLKATRADNFSAATARHLGRDFGFAARGRADDEENHFHPRHLQRGRSLCAPIGGVLRRTKAAPTLKALKSSHKKRPGDRRPLATWSPGPAALSRNYSRG